MQSTKQTNLKRGKMPPDSKERRKSKKDKKQKRRYRVYKKGGPLRTNENKNK
tara:strand:- start:53 stop:208 length:156 start_codon:yes stop_codon:yes gene_type:complete